MTDIKHSSVTEFTKTSKQRHKISLIYININSFKVFLFKDLNQINFTESQFTRETLFSKLVQHMLGIT